MAARISAAAANSNPYRKKAAREASYDPFRQTVKEASGPPVEKYSMKDLKPFFLRWKKKRRKCHQQQSEPAPRTSN